MRHHWGKIAIAGAALPLLVACASILGSTESTVQIRTSPDGATCELRGYEYTASVTAPATVTVPHKAAPVVVTCVAPGFRPTSNTLKASSDGLMWANSALIFGTAGVMVLGAMVDESRGAGVSYGDSLDVKLEPGDPRGVRVRSRSDGSELHLIAR
ncbi:MAG: hypothetical protein ACM33T_03940 [Solirubrobacterales bacterium]